MKPASIKRRLVVYLVNHWLAGTRYYKGKRFLLRSIGYEIGDNTNIVGPIFNTGEIKIGKDCHIGRNLTVHGNGQVVIGDRCDLAPDTTFLTGGHVIGGTDRRAGTGQSYKIQVEDGVWIGARATVVSNTTIGQGCVVAACACVTKDMPANTLVGGVPAQVIRELKHDRNGKLSTEGREGSI